MHRYERWILLRYLANALKASRFARPPRFGSDIVSWLETHGRSVGLPMPTCGSSPVRGNRFDLALALTEDWPEWRRKVIASAHERPPKPSPL